MIFTVTLNPALDREYIVPDLRENTVLRATAVNIDFGGKGFNVSRMLSSLGKESTALGFVGGKTGETLASGLNEAAIQTDFVEISGESRTNTSIVETNGKDHIKVNESGPVISAVEIRNLLEKIDQLVKAGDFWVLAGSLPPGVPVDIYAQMIERIKSTGARAILDTSGKPLKSGTLAGPYMIKPNVYEASELVGSVAGSNSQLQHIAAAIHNMGVEKIAISAGKGMALFSNGEKCWQVFPPQIEEANPIGAGDAMLAGIVFGLEAGNTDDKAFAWGIASGAAAAHLPGTGMPSRSEVESFLSKIKVKEV